MEFKLLLIFLSLFSSSLAQSISCEYWTYDPAYICEMNIDNPNGYDAFTSISGTHVSGKTNADVTQLSVAGITSTNFPRIICNTFPNLLTIHFPYVGVTSISDFSFAGCSRLDFLDLYGNSISQISSSAFVNNRQLYHLSLANNALTNVPANLLANQATLVELELNRNSLTDIPSTFFNSLTSLKDVRLMNNQLSVWHAEWFRTKTQLKYIDVGYNRIASIPTDAFHAANIVETLWIDNNQLRELRFGSFRSVFHFIDLYANDNSIEFIDRMILESPPQLYTVDLTNNVCASDSFYNFNENRTTYLNSLASCF